MFVRVTTRRCCELVFGRARVILLDEWTGGGRCRSAPAERDVPLKVVHISGPARSGKTTLARALAARRSDGKPHHLRLHAADNADASTDDSARPSLRLAVPLEEMATS